MCELQEKKRPTPLPDMSKKDKFSVWISNNCGITTGSNMRLKLVKELHRKGLNVNLNHSCISTSKTNPTRRHLSMMEFYDLISTHKFYLAFENGFHCREYITEKLWFNSFYAGTVPVVWGARKEDYIRALPPNSFIFYEDFPTSNKLINYLKYLDKNDSAYLEYFEWRKLYPCDYPLHRLNDEVDSPYIPNFSSTFLNAFCSLSTLLSTQQNNTKMKTISSLQDYWFNNESRDCLETLNSAPKS